MKWYARIFEGRRKFDADKYRKELEKEWEVTANLFSFLTERKNKKGSLKHIYCEGSRRHVLWWDSKGVHCSEPECEINKEK